MPAREGGAGGQLPAVEGVAAGRSADPSSARQAIAKLKSDLDRRGISICLSGVDGCGKSTLAGQLVELLTRSGIAARHLHLYQWYVNLAVTPILLIFNRYLGRKVLVLDRSIYDNIATLFLQDVPALLKHSLLKTILSVYPEFDYRICPIAPFDETLRRRPDTEMRRFRGLATAYEEICAVAGHARLPSDPTLFEEVLAYIARGANGPHGKPLA